MDLPVKYSPEHYEKKAQRYATTLRWLFNVRVDPPTKVRWASVISLARGIDTYLDDAPRSTLEKRTDEIEELLEQPDEIAKKYPALALDELGPDVYGRLWSTGLSIVRINLLIKSATSVREYATLRRVEGRDYARLITGLTTPQVVSQPGYASFETHMLRVGEVTNLLNSFRQINDDYQRGEIELVPNITTRPRLMGHICLALISPIYEESAQQSQSI